MQKSLLKNLVFVSLKSNKNFLVLFWHFYQWYCSFFLKKFSYFRQSAVAETTEHVINNWQAMIMDFCISLSTKQGNSGRIAVTQVDWIMSLVFRFSSEVFQSPRWLVIDTPSLSKSLMCQTIIVWWQMRASDTVVADNRAWSIPIVQFLWALLKRPMNWR